jgi:hypothetical protein
VTTTIIVASLTLPLNNDYITAKNISTQKKGPHRNTTDKSSLSSDGAVDARSLEMVGKITATPVTTSISALAPATATVTPRNSFTTPATNHSERDHGNYYTRSRI